MGRRTPGTALWTYNWTTSSPSRSPEFVTATVAVMTFEDLFLHEVPADPDTWAEMSERLEAWYVRHVEGDEAPRDLSDAYGRHLARTSPDGPPRRATEHL